MRRTDLRTGGIGRITPLLAAAFVFSPGCFAASSSLVGEYRDVSESDWVTVLHLESDGSAVIEQVVGPPGGAAGGSKTEIQGRWSPAPSGITLQYRGRVDTLAYSPTWNAAEFGAEGTGPGLRPVRPSGQSAFVGAFVLWRVEFLDSVQTHLP